MIRFYVTLKFVLVIMLSFVMVALNAQSSYKKLQAVYLYNFAKYISWPNQTPVFVIGILGELEIMEELQSTLKNKKVGGKEIEIKIIESDKIEEALQCQIVYVSESGSKNITQLYNSVADKGVLIVTENDLIKKGAMISFVVRDDHLAFKLKNEALLKAGLKASEGLLKLAITQ